VLRGKGREALSSERRAQRVHECPAAEGRSRMRWSALSPVERCIAVDRVEPDHGLRAARGGLGLLGSGVGQLARGLELGSIGHEEVGAMEDDDARSVEKRTTRPVLAE